MVLPLSERQATTWFCKPTQGSRAEPLRNTSLYRVAAGAGATEALHYHLAREAQTRHLNDNGPRLAAPMQPINHNGRYESE